MKKIGREKLESIPPGKRSGKSSDINGMALFYREKKNLEGIHLLYYDYDAGKLDHINDVSWIFQKIQCKEDEPLRIPIEGYEAYRQFQVIDKLAKSKIITEVNSPYDAREGLKVKPRNQREVLEIILELFKQGKLPKDKTMPLYEILLRQNLVAWEVEFGEYVRDYKRDRNADALLSSVDGLIQKYKIQRRESASRKKLEPDDLTIIGYIFLSKPGMVFPMLAG